MKPRIQCVLTQWKAGSSASGPASMRLVSPCGAGAGGRFTVLRPRPRRIDRMVSLFLLAGCNERNCRSGCDYRRPQRSAEPEGKITRHAVARGGTSEQAATTFRDVFAVAEFRALWLAQLLSVIGDQLARVALTVLVYDRTRSALLAAVTFVASIVPTFVGGVTLAWLADRYPRRARDDRLRPRPVRARPGHGHPRRAAGRAGHAALPGHAGRRAVHLGARGHLSRRADRRQVRDGDRGDAHHVPVRAGPRVRGGGRRSSASSALACPWSSTRRPSPHQHSSSRPGFVHDPPRRPAVTTSHPGWPASSPAPGSSSPARPCACRCSSAGWRRSTTLRRAWSLRSPGTCTAARSSSA